MAAFDYAAAQVKADTIIRKFARNAGGVVVPGILRRPTTTGGSVTTPGTHGSSDTPAIMVAVDYNVNERDDTIQTKDRRVMISPLAPDGGPLSEIPTTKHRVVLPGTTEPAYEIVRVKPLDPAGIDVFYDCQVRFG